MTTTEWHELLAERLSPKPNPWRGDPVGWVERRAREHLTDDQKLIAESIVKNRFTAVKSCNGVGKSRTASRIAAWWIDSHPLGEAFVVTTAPTRSQVHNVLWRYIGQLHRQLDLPGYITGDDDWKLGHDGSSPEPIAIGRKPADNSPADLSGVHAPFVLVILDEAGGVPESLYHVLASLATNRNSRTLAIGNPDDPSSHFKKVCEPGSVWNTIHIDALRSDNMTHENLKPFPRVRKLMIKSGIPPAPDKYIPPEVRDGLVDPGWVDEQISAMGIDSPMFTSKVRGEFPTITNDTLIAPHFITLAWAREGRSEPFLGRLGVDVARYGADHTIIVERQGAVARVVADIPYGSVTHTAGEIQRYAFEHYQSHDIIPPPACVDDAGVGGGVVDILSENGYPVIPVVHSQGSVQKLPNGKPRFFNRRSELLWNVREALMGRSGTGEDAWLDLDEKDLQMAAQLGAIKYTVNQHGQIVVESKDQMKARGLPSPDRADALSYSLAVDDLYTGEAVDPRFMISGDVLTKKW